MQRRAPGSNSKRGATVYSPTSGRLLKRLLLPISLLTESIPRGSQALLFLQAMSERGSLKERSHAWLANFLLLFFASLEVLEPGLLHRGGASFGPKLRAVISKLAAVAFVPTSSGLEAIGSDPKRPIFFPVSQAAAGTRLNLSRLNLLRLNLSRAYDMPFQLSHGRFCPYMSY